LKVNLKKKIPADILQLISSLAKHIHTVAGTNPSFVGPEAHIIVVALLKKKNTKLGTKLNIYLE